MVDLDMSEVKMLKALFVAISVTFLIGLGEGLNKYSAEANVKSDITNEPPSDFRNLEKPFRMAKINMLWSKAQLVRNIVFKHVLLNCYDIVLRSPYVLCYRNFCHQILILFLWLSDRKILSCHETYCIIAYDVMYCVAKSVAASLFQPELYNFTGRQRPWSVEI